MKTEALSLIETYGPLTTGSLHHKLSTMFDIVMDRGDLFDFLNIEAKRRNIVRSSGSALGGQGNYGDILCFYWSKSE